jgi:hypothetical protein
MKLLIVLFLVIGAVVSQIELTTPAAVTAPLWTLTYSAPTGFNYYSFSLTYYSGTSATDALAASGTSNSFGVACMITDSAFALATTDVRAGFSFSVTGATNKASTSVNTDWEALLMVFHPTMVYNTGNTIDTGAASVACPITMTQTGQPLPDISTSVTPLWTFTVADGCGSLPPMGTGWFARCFSVADQGKIISATGDIATVAVLGDTNITIAATTTACVLSGASTIAI